MGPKVVNNEKFTLDRIENFLDDEEGSFVALEDKVACKKKGKVVMALEDFEKAFGGVDAKI